MLFWKNDFSQTKRKGGGSLYIQRSDIVVIKSISDNSEDSILPDREDLEGDLEDDLDDALEEFSREQTN